jgi:transposase-like protein
MIIFRLRCPACQARNVEEARITPGHAGFDIRKFKCAVCGNVHHLLMELVDPMKSRETAGWLRGELRAPT